MVAYDPNNIFAKILRGELPCYKVYEDDKALAFLDILFRAGLGTDRHLIAVDGNLDVFFFHTRQFGMHGVGFFSLGDIRAKLDGCIVGIGLRID